MKPSNVTVGGLGLPSVTPTLKDLIFKLLRGKDCPSSADFGGSIS
jgi:hypothetical protein